MNETRMLYISIFFVVVCIMGLGLAGGIPLVANFLGNAFDKELTFTEQQLDKSLSREHRENIGRLSK